MARHLHQVLGQELTARNRHFPRRDLHLLWRAALEVGIDARCGLLGRADGVDDRDRLGDGIASGKDARLVGHVGHAIDVEGALSGDGKAVSLVQEGKVGRLAYGLHHHVQLEHELGTGDGHRAAAARAVWLAQLHAHAFQRGHLPELAAQHADRRDQVLDGDALVFGLLDLFGQGRHLGLGAAVEDAHIVHAQSFQRAGHVHGGVAAADDPHPGGCASR